MENRDTGNRRSIEDVVLDSYPFPIAFLLAHRVISERDPEKRVRGMAHTFEHSLRYLAMLVLGEYAVFPESDQNLNEVLERLRRPSAGDLSYLVREGVRRLDARGHDWFIGELPAVLERLQGANRLSSSLGHQNLIDGLLGLRNRLAHHEYDSNWPALEDDYYPLLLDFLSHLAVLAEYPLCRFIEHRSAAHSAVADLSGYVEPFPERLITRHRQLENATSDLFLSTSLDDRILPLRPFIVMQPCEDCRKTDQSGPSEEVFLLNGSRGENTSFIGVRHGMRVRDTSFEEFRESKRILPPTVPAQNLARDELLMRTRRITKTFLEAQLRHGVFIPQIYLPRPEIEKQLESFLLNESAAFLLLGQTGMGKTNLLCHWTSRVDERGIPALYFPAADLDFSLLESLVLSTLGLKGSLADLLSSLDDMHPLVLIIDGLNENPSVLLAVRQLHKFICSYSKQNLKVVFSLRTSHFRQILAGLVDTRLDRDGTSFFVSDIYHTAEVEGAAGSRPTYQHVLTRIEPDSQELQQIYDSYRNYHPTGSTLYACRFSPVTLFAQLSRNVRDLITNPWHLRLVMETYHQLEIPPRIFSTDLLREYCQRLIFFREDTANFAQKLIDQMCEQQTTSLTRAELESHAQLSAAMADSSYEPSPYNRLIEDGVLVEFPEIETRGVFMTTRYRVQFAFDSVMEFLIANQVLSMGTAEPEPIQMLLSGSVEYLPFAGAVQSIWAIHAQSDNGDLILKCIDSCDGSILRPLVPTLRQLEAHGHPAYDRILNKVANDSEGKSALILLMLGEGMGVENGIEAQNRVFEKLFSWQGNDAKAFHFCAARYLIFGYVIADKEAEAVAIYNQLQEIYAADTKTLPSLVRLDGHLTAKQKERVFEFAWVAERYGLNLLTKTFGQTAEIDQMLGRLKLDWFSDRMKHDLASLIDLIARYKAMTATEAAMSAAEKVAEAERSNRPQDGLRAFDNVGLNIGAISYEQLPEAIKEVEAELGFLHDAYRVGTIGAEDNHNITERMIRVYFNDRRDGYAYLRGKLTELTAILGNNLIIAEGYKKTGQQEKCIEFLLRAEEYISASEASGTQLQVCRLLKEAASGFGALGQAAAYADRYLECESYLELSDETRDILLKDDAFQLFAKYFNVDPDTSERLYSTLESSWYTALLERCGPWLAPDEGMTVIELHDQAKDWESYLRAKVYNYDKIRNEQRVLEIIKLLIELNSEEKSRTDGDLTFSDLIGGRLLLISMKSEYYQPGKDPPTSTESEGLEKDPVEYEHVLEEVRRNWGLSSCEERLTNAAGAAVFPAFVPLICLEEDAEFCARIGKEPNTAVAAKWISSVVRCWFSDIAKGRRTNDAVRDYLKILPNANIALRESPQIILAMTALSVFWSRLKEQLDPGVISRLTELSVSTDNLDAMIDEIRKAPKTVSADCVVAEIKDELCQVHKALLTDFGS